MKNSTIDIQYFCQLLVIDILITCLALLIPALLHKAGSWIRFFEPMRVALFISVILISERKNNFLLAILLPFASLIFVGAIPFWKSMLMSYELLVNLLLLYWLLDRGLYSAIAAGLSTLCAKICYFGTKYLMIRLMILPEMGIIGDFKTQILAIALSSVSFPFFRDVLVNKFSLINYPLEYK